MNVGLVVARYREDVSWLNEFTDMYKNLYVYVYNKYPEPIIGAKRYYYEFRENVGNEAETYLSHMIRYYRTNRDDITLYVQGNPFDHVRKDQLHEVISNPDRVDTFQWLASHILDCRVANECHHHALPITEFYQDIFNKQVPELFHFGVGGQFVIHSSILDTVPLDRLYLARELILTTYRNNEPWCILERLWNQLVTP